MLINYKSISEICQSPRETAVKLNVDEDDDEKKDIASENKDFEDEEEVDIDLNDPDFENAAF